MKRNGVWASGDRRTVESRAFELTLPDGTIERWEIEEVELTHPLDTQLGRSDYGIRVVPIERAILDAATGKRVHYTRYWSFMQSFYDGPGANGDLLGGFCTGKMVEYLNRDKYLEAMEKLRYYGFKEVARHA